MLEERRVRPVGDDREVEDVLPGSPPGLVEGLVARERQNFDVAGHYSRPDVARLKVNLLPDISYPTITVRTELTGAAPVDVENLLTKPIEESVGVIRNVRTVRSVSRSGQSDVTLEFLWGTDMDIASVDVREKLDLIERMRATAPAGLKGDCFVTFALSGTDAACAAAKQARMATGRNQVIAFTGGYHGVFGTALAMMKPIEQMLKVLSRRASVKLGRLVSRSVG